MALRRWIALLALLGIHGPAFAITAGQIDDFEDGTVQNWKEGPVSPNPPTNVANGGPQGQDDNYLRNRSSGGDGAGSRMVMFNQIQWTGDYVAAGVTAIRIYLRNQGNTAMRIRIAVQGHTSSTRYSTDGFDLPAENVWRQADFSLAPADLLLVSGTATAEQVLASVSEVRILHSPGPTFDNPPPIDALLGVDDIEAVGPAEPEDKFFDLAALPDVNDSSSADLAVLVSDFGGGFPAATEAVPAQFGAGNQVFVKDGASGEEIQTMEFLTTAWTGQALAGVPGGVIRLGVLATKADGSIRVQVRNAVTGGFIGNFDYLNSNAVPADLAGVPDAFGVGKPGFAVLAVRGNGNIVVELRRATNGALISQTLFHNSNWVPIALGVFSDLNGNNRSDIGVLARNAAGSIRLEIRDGASGNLINRSRFFGSAWTPLGLVEVADFGAGNRPEVAVMARRSNGRNKVQTRDSRTDALLNNTLFFGTQWTPLGLQSISDSNGNTVQELAMLARHDDGRLRVQVRDAATDQRLNTISFLFPSWTAWGYAALEDFNGNGVDELAVMGRKDDGTVRIQVRDGSSGNLLKNISIP